MLDGKYGACLNTPMGKINGTISLKCNGNIAQGVLEIMGMKNNFQGNVISENQCQFKGNFNTPLGNIQYSADCIVNGNSMELIANTNKGNFKLQGKRI